MRRRTFLKTLVSAGGATVLCSCGRRAHRGGRPRRVIILAFDGLDPGLTRQLMDAGRMPNFRRVARRGGFAPIATTTPPITPVAFSSIISGTDPGTHNIYDFIHRDPDPKGSALAVEPYFSLSAAVPPEHDWSIPLGDWRLPLTGGSVKSLRRGPTFWDALLASGENVDLYHVPATYPPPEAEQIGRFRCLSGMGTPDLLGTYGEFTLFASDLLVKERRVGGGRFVQLDMKDNAANAELEGPQNFLRRPDASGARDRMRLPIRIVRDPQGSVLKIEIDDRIVILKAGEWSAWVDVRFQTRIPASAVLSAMQAPTSVPGMVRFCAKEVHPHIKLYVSPINIDPKRPANPLSEPPDFASELARAHGRFYTTGIPEDTKALSRGALNEDEFLAQTDLVLEEKIAEYYDSIRDFRRGCLFSYFGTTDLVQHMFWRDRDPTHPGRLPEQGDRYAGVIEDLYERADAIVGETLSRLVDDDVLLVLSDHGFASFRREVDINTWLVDHGYMTLIDASNRSGGDWLTNVDWSRTRAYALGLNGIYFNLRGREKHGIVYASEHDALARRISLDLPQLREEDGTPAIEGVFDRRALYPGADGSVAPDLIVGYREGYRASWKTVQGGLSEEVLSDNHDRWSGTHCIAPRFMPGVLFSTQPIRMTAPALTDIAPTILGAFGAPRPAEMTGRNVLAAT
ncbi:MAG: alkaline phosphatase family protein [Planctomycetota bacterium]|nr:alkaline phosphatase family protein [Planctomycetota bacterium]